MCWWARGHNAKEIQTVVTQGADEVTNQVNSDPNTDVTAVVSGRDIHLTGVMPKNAHDEIIQQYMDVKGRRVVTEDDVTQIAIVSPYTLSIEKSGDNWSATGYGQSEDDIAAFDSKVSGASLELAGGAPEGWNAAVDSAVNALGHLQNGQASLSDTNITITGDAATGDDRAAAEQALANIPSGFNVSQEISAPVEGPDFKVEFDITEGIAISGTSVSILNPSPNLPKPFLLSLP